MVENGGGGGGVEALVERMRVERIVWENEKKKEKKWSEWAGQREKMDSMKMSGGKWWVVGLGGGHMGTIKRNLTFTFFFFFFSDWDVT